MYQHIVYHIDLGKFPEEAFDPDEVIAELAKREILVREDVRVL